MTFMLVPVLCLAVGGTVECFFTPRTFLGTPKQITKPTWIICFCFILTVVIFKMTLGFLFSFHMSSWFLNIIYIITRPHTTCFVSRPVQLLTDLCAIVHGLTSSTTIRTFSITIFTLHSLTVFQHCLALPIPFHFLKRKMKSKERFLENTY